jgi:4-oxalocrotonate tautomerase
MPFIDVSLGAGRSPEQIRRLIHELTHAAQRAVDAPLANIRVVVREIPPTHWAAGDVTIEERTCGFEKGQAHHG